MISVTVLRRLQWLGPMESRQKHLTLTQGSPYVSQATQQYRRPSRQRVPSVVGGVSFQAFLTQTVDLLMSGLPQNRARTKTLETGDEGKIGRNP